MPFTSKTMADLFLGHKVIDRKKQELRQILPMLNGMLAGLDWGMPEPDFRHGSHDSEEPPRGIWLCPPKSGEWGFWMEKEIHSGRLIIVGYCPSMIRHTSDELDFLGGDNQFPAGPWSHWREPGHSVPPSKMMELHAALPAAIDILLQHVPGLEKKIQPFLDQAKEARR